MNTDDLYDALEQCAANSSKKTKLEIVKGLGEMRPWLRWALDPTISFYVAKLAKPTRSGADVLGADDEQLLDRLATRRLSGNEALQRIDDTMRELSPKSQEVLRRILLKDLRCGVGETIVNEAFPGLLPVFPYMRCTLPKDSNIEKWDWSQGVYVQLKADGMFANVNIEKSGDLSIFSRTGSRFPACSLGVLEQVLFSQLAAGTQTHGELVVYNGAAGAADGPLPRHIGNGILNSLLQGGELPEHHTVALDVWDQIPLHVAVDKGRYDVPYEERFERLENQCVGAHHDLVQPIESQIVYSKAEALAVCGRYQKRKLEGAICKHRKAPWRDGDNKDLVKLKLEVDVDLEVEEILPGNEGTKNDGKPGRLVMKTSCGELKVRVAVKNETMRAELAASPELYIGKIMPVRANAVMEPSEEGELYSLFLPRFAEDTPRADKREADSLQRVRAQFDAAVSV